ncbi:uncharacterized protein [Salvelinus sp. IW2-2015]|uniref:uncharacterized protein n=1 Tax=Salvelinus sp. IW2-2015 TaxID=2691554 RepID=UPI0038D3FC20
MTFTLRLINIRSEDAGLYTCMLQNQKENKLWRPGVLLRPGETRPTLLPVTKPQPQGIPNSTPNGRCTKGNYQTPKGCGSKVLWPLVGVLLAVALISTQYYFSRKDHWSNSERPHCRRRDSAVFTVCPYRDLLPLYESEDCFIILLFYSLFITTMNQSEVPTV